MWVDAGIPPCAYDWSRVKHGDTENTDRRARCFNTREVTDEVYYLKHCFKTKQNKKNLSSSGDDKKCKFLSTGFSGNYRYHSDRSCPPTGHVDKLPYGVRIFDPKNWNTGRTSVISKKEINTILCELHFKW